MKIPDRESFIEMLTFLQEYCKAPKERECESCVLHHGDFGVVCLMDMWPEYWEIDEIVKRLYGKGGGGINDNNFGLWRTGYNCFRGDAFAGR